MKVWVSKYALSDGITEHECEPPNEAGWVYPGGRFMSYTGFKMGRDAHDSREAAVHAAEQARKRKLASIRKQIARLETMTF